MFVADGRLIECGYHRPSSLLVFAGTVVIGSNVGIQTLHYAFHAGESNQSNEQLAVFEKQVPLESLFFVEPGKHLTCGELLTISNAMYTQLDSYKEGVEIYYLCKDSYTIKETNNNILVCGIVDDKLTWIGQHIECQLSTVFGKELSSFSILGKVFHIDNF